MPRKVKKTRNPQDFRNILAGEILSLYYALCELEADVPEPIKNLAQSIAFGLMRRARDIVDQPHPEVHMATREEIELIRILAKEADAIHAQVEAQEATQRYRVN